MFDASRGCEPPPLAVWTAVLAESDLPTSPAAQIDEIRALEELACAARARQARLAAELDAANRAAGHEGRGVAEQVALARRESPHRGRQHLALARIADELPHAMAAFRRGLVTEWRVTVLARETACLTLGDRLAVDRAIAGDAEAFSDCSDRAVLTEIRKLVAHLDPAAVAERRRRAETERCVTVRPAPDTMVYLTALLPVAQGVAAYAALSAAADRARAAGDPRGRHQVMADTLVARTTGSADADGHPVVPVSIGLVMTDRALFSGAHDDAAIVDHGPIPADLARSLVLRSTDAATRTWVRRLYRHPESHELVAMDSGRRRFPRQLAAFLRLRDQWCRTPGAAPRSATATTSTQSPRAAPRTPLTARACARRATTPSRRPAGDTDRGPGPAATPSRSPPPPVTPTGRPPHRSWGCDIRRSGRSVRGGGC